MKYVIGTQIPSKEILRRFKDEDGEIFVEIRDMNDVLFRVTDGDRVYYKIEKSKMKGEELTLVVDYTIVRPKSINLQNIPKKKDEVVWEDNSKKIDDLWGATSEDDDENNLDEKTDFDEGEVIPKHLRALCQENEYGGYTLRYEKFIYMLDKNYLIEIKTMDSTDKYELESTGDEADDIMTLSDPLSETDTDTGFDMDMMMEPAIELEKGEILPARLRTQCEAELGHNYGSRITLGNYLYHLDHSFKVLRKMRITFMEDSDSKDPKSAPQSNIEDTSSSPKKLSTEEIIYNVINAFTSALDTYNIQADYFKETVLDPNNSEILLHTYHGDLEQLNDDTREAASQGKIVKLPDKESGFNLFKAVLIHELYIKSTVTGRGENMKQFLTVIAAIHPDGTLNELQDNNSLEEQRRMVNFFKNRAHVYTDKTDTITRVYLQIRSNIYDQYEKLLASKEKVRFNPLLVCKLYELTTRLDRGNGITMIRLTRDLLEYPYIDD
jgi:hypothetical protein